MNTGSLNRTIIVSQKSESVSSGNVTETWSTPVNVRAKVTQVDGTRFMTSEELVDKTIYKIECWDFGFTDNVKIVYEGNELTLIRPITTNDSLKSKMKECVIYASYKR